MKIIAMNKEEYNGSDSADGGRVGDASIGNDVVEERLDDVPFLEKVLLEHALFGIQLVLFLIHRHHRLLIRFHHL